MFGHKWVSSFGEDIDPDKVWLATLGGVSDEQVKAGLKRLADSGAEWPPSAPEFRNMCLNDGQHWEHKAFDLIAAQTDAMLALPKPERNLNVGREALAEFKNKIGVA